MAIHPHRRSVALLVAGVVLGTALMTPAGAHVGGTVLHLWRKHLRPLAKQTFYTKTQSNNRFVEGKRVRIGSVSCPGIAWEEYNSSIVHAFGEGGALRTVASGDGSFGCNVALPDKAVITAASVTVRDDQSPNLLCDLARISMANGTMEEMAAMNSTGTPGITRITDSTIGTPTVDNHAYSYLLHCFISGANTGVGLYGGTVDYTITGSKGAAT